MIGRAGRWPAPAWIAGQRPALPFKATRPTVGGLVGADRWWWVPTVGGGCRPLVVGADRWWWVPT
ncbi:hypothetical protein, partial [Stenotrophomonas sp.]|uniref:hypothetical protein n=1 Tax=Stenotrophomonas sp. TaxID=69392 RepID=UPI002899A987